MELEKKEKTDNEGEMVMEKYYRAIIKEDDEIIKNIAYKCNQKDKCCNSELCGTECQYTLNKKYAIDLATEESKQTIETRIYTDGKLTKRIIEYK